MPDGDYPVQFSVDYPDRPLNRLTTFFRIFTAIPILILLATIAAAAPATSTPAPRRTRAGGCGLLFIPPLLMILFRRKYPRWWFDWNLELLRFSNRIYVYVALMDDRYPSTDEEPVGAPRLRLPGRRARPEPLAAPGQVVPGDPPLHRARVLWILAFFCVVIAWFAILFTGRYPRGLFGIVESVMRWGNRVAAYAFLLVTDRYPPFSFS